MSTIRNADRIYVLQNGTVVEEGIHDTLLSRENGIYKEMIHLQQGDMTDNHVHDNIEMNEDMLPKIRNTASSLLTDERKTGDTGNKIVNRYE